MNTHMKFDTTLPPEPIWKRASRNSRALLLDLNSSLGARVSEARHTAPSETLESIPYRLGPEVHAVNRCPQGIVNKSVSVPKHLTHSTVEPQLLRGFANITQLLDVVGPIVPSRPMKGGFTGLLEKETTDHIRVKGCVSRFRTHHIDANQHRMQTTTNTTIQK
ncbi:uncharacterized protein BDR25DRAFT_361533 [Lindgomyces ingoldianus]|uniref:Uncharacterized protein n=1 Tax=Lindgomyces ingoldianus TaxID=673940 RepID=A0ACB6QC16_9PLEO|nr:uncharacterized protein BDR25DRAFT_361533 [Lindgomyces ingoldianus]KAF2464469.1 hypothetical protein BDR25DRAFT_361533 [Lindgomyces ingoldianus]